MLPMMDCIVLLRMDSIVLLRMTSIVLLRMTSIVLLRMDSIDVLLLRMSPSRILLMVATGFVGVLLSVVSCGDLATSRLSMCLAGLFNRNYGSGLVHRGSLGGSWKLLWSMFGNRPRKYLSLAS